MSAIDYDLRKLRGVVFDVDGVLSPSTIPMSDDGVPMRMVNIKDGYAMQLAAKKGLRLAIITGAKTQSVIHRYNALGINDVYIGVALKRPVMERWMAEKSLAPEEVAYVGDDIPDYEVMKMVGLPVAPADAATEIKDAARYISPREGGHGVARDLLEQILKAKGEWLNAHDAFGW